MPVLVGCGLNAAQLLRALSAHVAMQGAGSERWPVLVRTLEERDALPVDALLLVYGGTHPHFEIVTGWFGERRAA